MQADLSGKVCLVTGANSGIGKETTRALAEMGARLVMVCRSEERGTAAQRELKQDTGRDQIDLLLADLSVQADVRRVAAEFKEKYDRLDVLVNNAGALFTDYRESEDGIEMTFALNHLGYFLLTEELLPTLIETPQARVVNVASGAHQGAKIHFDNVQLTGEYGAMKAYAQSKLANILFTRELARRLADKQADVTANALHPGFVGSNFAMNNGLFAKALLYLLRPFARSEEKGAETPIYLAASPEVTDVTGQYFVDCEPKTPSAAARDDAAARRLWELSVEMTIK